MVLDLVNYMERHEIEIAHDTLKAVEGLGRYLRTTRANQRDFGALFDAFDKFLTYDCGIKGGSFESSLISFAQELSALMEMARTQLWEELLQLEK